MLVLTRRLNESIVIDGNIIVTVARISGDKVRLGVTCDRAIPVHRSEIQAVIERARRAVPTDDDDPGDEWPEVGFGT